MAIVLKSKEEVELMRRASRIVAMVWEGMRDMVAPGVNTLQLDEAAERIIRQNGGVPSFKGYPYRGVNDFPASICTSINQQIVHGIPSPTVVLQEGDIISIDVGAIYEGYHGDGAITLAVGQVSGKARRLLEVTKGALGAGIAQMRVGNKTSDISRAIEQYVHAHGMEVVREYTGHGIGRQMHEEPQVTNYTYPGMPEYQLAAGMTLALEPMVVLGTWRTRVLPDGWAVETADGKLSAHFEHTVVVTDGDALVLTRLDREDGLPHQSVV